MTHDDVTPALNAEQDDGALSHDAIGAYILGALPDAEAIAFEDHLRDCPQCQQELRELGPIATLLPRLYDDLDLPGLDPLPLDLDASVDVRSRIVAEASGTRIEEAVAGSTIAGIEWVDPDADHAQAAGDTTADRPALEQVDLAAGTPDGEPIEPSFDTVSREHVAAISDPPTLAGVDASVEVAVPELSDPVIPNIASPAFAAEASVDAEAIAAQVAADDAAEADNGAPVVAISEAKRRPRGRIAPGEAPPGANVVSIPKQRSSILPWAIAAAAAILATGAILWTLAMMGQIDDLEAERDLQDQQIAQMNSEREQYLAQTPANIYPLVSTTANQGGDSSATAMVYMDPDPNGWGGIVAFRDMDQPPSGQVYQLWMISDGQPTPGPTFMPDADGEAMVQVGEDAATAGAMAITVEPDGGSQTPTTSPIMQGSLTA